MDKDELAVRFFWNENVRRYDDLRLEQIDPRKINMLWHRVAEFAQTIIAERVREARRECYNAVCAQFGNDPNYNRGVTACRDAIAKLIDEGESI